MYKNVYFYMKVKKQLKKSSFRNRVQSSLEYLSVYALVIIIISVSIAVLYSLNFFAPPTVGSSFSAGFVGFQTQAECVVGSTLITSFTNLQKIPIYFGNINITLSNDSTIVEPLDYYFSPGTSHTFFLQNACPNSTGKSYLDRIMIYGSEPDSFNASYALSGSLSGRVGALSPYKILESIALPAGSFPTVNAVTNNGYYIWQPNQGTSTVSIINVISASVVKTLTNMPVRSIVFSKNGQLAFMAGNSPASPRGEWMAVMNTSTYTIIKNISGICDPQILAMSYNGSRLIIPGWPPSPVHNVPNTCDRLLILNTSSLNFIDNVSEDGFDVWSAEESPNGQYIYLSSTNNNKTVSIMNTQSYSITKNLTGFVSPEPILFNQNGQDVYIGDGKFLIEISTSSQSIVDNVSFTASAISGITSSPSYSYLYTPVCTSSTGDGVIGIFDTASNSFTNSINLGVYNHCMSYAVLTKNGNFLYAASASGNFVFIISV